MAKKGIKNDQVYRGRWKGKTDTHVPNALFRQRAEEMGLGGHEVRCEKCGKVYRGTKVECAIWVCDCNLGGD